MVLLLVRSNGEIMAFVYFAYDRFFVFNKKYTYYSPPSAAKVVASGTYTINNIFPAAKWFSYYINSPIGAQIRNYCTLIGGRTTVILIGKTISRYQCTVL